MSQLIKHLTAIGAKGGKSKSEPKMKAMRINLEKARKAKRKAKK